MKPGNFNWFIHVMLFFHTQTVLAKQKAKKEKKENAAQNSDDEESDEEGAD